MEMNAGMDLVWMDLDKFGWIGGEMDGMEGKLINFVATAHLAVFHKARKSAPHSFGPHFLAAQETSLVVLQ